MKQTKKITILHSNDLHGDFLAEQVDEKLVGGVSMLSGYIEKVRAEEPNTIYAIAGDMFRGSVIDSEYKGLSTIEIMNALAPDIVTIGNHEVEENGVIIAQAGTGTDQIGRFDIIVDTDNNCIDSYTWHTVPICADTCPRNPAMEQVLHRFTSQVDEKYSHIVGRFRRELTHPQRTRETELGNLFADIFTRSLGIDVMLIGSGSIRAEKLGPIVTYGDLIEGFPYDDGVFMFKVTGQQLRQMLHYMLREEAYTGHTEFYQLPSTLRLRYDRAKGDFDYFTYCGKEVGKEIGDDALFTVGLQNYHFKNIESFFNISYDTICKIQKPRSVATSCQDILMEYFREHEMLDAAVDGRMTILPPAGQ